MQHNVEIFYEIAQERETMEQTDSTTDIARFERKASRYGIEKQNKAMPVVDKLASTRAG